MNSDTMAKLLHQYQRAVSMVDPLRYSCTVSAIQASENIFGMNFEKLFSLPQEEQGEWFVRQQNQAELLRSLFSGKPVEDAAFAQAFGFSKEELFQQLQIQRPIKKEIPDRLVVLNFDDAMRDQYETVAPLLVKYGFHATFFIAEMPDSPRGQGFTDKNRYMTWEQMKELQQAGFELGNHTKNHVWGLHTMGRDTFVGEIRALEADFAAHGLEAPTAFAYPSGIANSEAAGFVRECGYLWGRGNCETGLCGMRGMSYYDPACDSPLAMPNFGDPDYYTEELLRARIAGAADGKILGLTYHSVSPEHWGGACSFERQMQILADCQCMVISIRDLEAYIDPRKADLCNPV